MTRTALEKIEKMEHNGSLDWILICLTDAFQGRQRDLVNEYSSKLRGYLMALVDVGVITTSDLRCLYLYYKQKCNKE